MRDYEEWIGQNQLMRVEDENRLDMATSRASKQKQFNMISLWPRRAMLLKISPHATHTHTQRVITENVNAEWFPWREKTN